MSKSCGVTVSHAFEEHDAHGHKTTASSEHGEKSHEVVHRERGEERKGDSSISIVVATL